MLQPLRVEQPRLVPRSKHPDGNSDVRQLRAELPEGLPRTCLLHSHQAPGEGPGWALLTLQSTPVPRTTLACEVTAGARASPETRAQALPGPDPDLLIHVHRRVLVHDDAITSWR